LNALYLFGLYLLFLAFRAYGIRDILAFAFAGMMLIGTNLIHYVAKEPAMPHAANITLINTLLFLSTRERKTARYGFFVGLLLGLLLITRNATIALMPWIVFILFRNSPAPRWRGLFLVGIISMGLIHLGSFYLLWGQPVLRTYGDESFTGGLKGMIGTLWGARHGLFIYHPWYLVLFGMNFIGLWRVRTERVLLALGMTGFVLLWIFNGNWWCWWFGAGFGNRAFVETLPLLSFGAALVAEHEFDRCRPIARRLLWMILLILVVANLYLWSGYLLRKYSPSGRHTVHEVYFWPLK
jgi:hypothetical protein